MSYKKIYPLGKRNGPGSYDSFWQQSAMTMQEAIEKKALIIVDFVENEKGIIYFEAYHMRHPEDKRYHRLEWQHFPVGVDTRDDWAAQKLVTSLIIKYDYNNE